MATVPYPQARAVSGTPGRTLPWGQALSYVALGLGAAIMLAPFIWMLATSLKPTGDVFKYPPTLIGSAIEWRNYLTVFQRSPFAQQLWNTVFIAVITTVGALITSAMGGYAFSWIMNFRGKNTLFLVFLVSIMIPYHLLLVPTFALLRNMQLLDTPWAIILPSVVSPFGIFLMRQFFTGIPRELAEAATLDGCSPWGIFWRIFLPLSKPALTTLAIFTFVGTWNDFLRPLIYLSSNENQTLTLGIYAAQGSFSTNWPVLMAMVTLSLLPVVIMFLSLQDLFVKGVALTGIKG
jgi:multiple sugar transport system permease protein